MEQKKRLFVDMDGTLARFHDQENYLERMFEQGFFRNLAPFETMVEGIRLFMQDHPDTEVFVMSAKINSEYCVAEKNEWVDAHLPEIDKDHRIYTEMGRPKAECIPGGHISKDDYLLDDYNRGLNQWLYDGGSAIKCHNNINQRGLGAYGGSAGMLWDSSMVHTDDTPELIAAELAQHMSLRFDLQKVLAAQKEIHFADVSPQNWPYSPEEGKTLVMYHEGVYAGHEIYTPHYFATHIDAQDGDLSNFINPLNAIRWLSGKKEFQELDMEDPLSGISMAIPKFRADAMAQNIYNCSIDALMDRHDYRWDVPSVFCEAISMSEQPIVGRINFLKSDGTVGESCIFRRVEDMQKEIAESRDCGRPFTEEWYVTIREPEKDLSKEITLNTYPDLGLPESFTLSLGNLQMAMKVCDSYYLSVDEFLSEYTWDDSMEIFEKYAQYVERAVKAQDGFFSRKQVEEMFYEKMCQPGATPEGVALWFEGREAPAPSVPKDPLLRQISSASERKGESGKGSGAKPFR